MTETEELFLLERRNASKPAKKDSAGRILRKAAQTIFRHPFAAWRALSSSCADKAALKAGGGLGDLLRANAMLLQFYQEYPSVMFDVYVHNPELGTFLFGSLPNVRYVYYEHLFPVFKYRYAFSFETLQLAQLCVYNRAYFPEGVLKNRNRIQNFLDIYEKHGEHAWRSVVRAALECGMDFMDVLYASAGLSGLGEKQAYLEVSVPNPLAGQKYLTFSTSSNIRDGLHTAATKCWPQEYWTKLIGLLHEKYPSYQFIQLGEQNAKPVRGADVSFLGKTGLQTTCAILLDSLLHIDCDCGLVHFAKALNVPCVVLFGPTAAGYVGYAENENITAPFCGNCWHASDSWNKECPLGFSNAKCMYSISPEMVLEKIKIFLRSKYETARVKP
ncbi:MAG: glycosyltransferase family 9 protein [Elusimicrobia bacterium]|nr:glycosyltransferase family 9 protein [Elusimicrobiota bacterium]